MCCSPGTRSGLPSVALLAPLLLGCGGDAVAPTRIQGGRGAASLYWALALDHKGITLSNAPPYDTLTITATPRDGKGLPLPALGAVTYRSTDLEHVRVSPDGLLQAVRAGAGVRVIAELATGNVRHADTAIVNVTDDPAPRPMASFSIQLPPSDSARWPMEGAEVVFGLVKVIAAHAADADGDSIRGLSVHYASSDTTVATIDPITGRLEGMRPGHVTLSAAATAYGSSMTDSLQFTITMPLFQWVQITTDTSAGSGAHFQPSEIRITPGGTIMWLNRSRQPVDVMFDDPANVAERTTLRCYLPGDPGGVGDIPAFGDTTGNIFSPPNCRSRRFPVPGTYTYQSTLTGATGRVVVASGVDP